MGKIIKLVLSASLAVSGCSMLEDGTIQPPLRQYLVREDSESIYNSGLFEWADYRPYRNPRRSFEYDPMPVWNMISIKFGGRPKK